MNSPSTFVVSFVVTLGALVGNPGSLQAQPGDPPPPDLAPAPGTDWSKAFVAQAVGAHLPAGTTGVAVVSAGTAVDANPAAAALEAALRASGKAPLVLNDESLGAADTEADAAIVKRASHLPVSVIAIVRVFPGPAGSTQADQRAVVTLYRKDGTVVTAFSTEAGVAMATAPGAVTGTPGNTTPNPSDGVSKTALDSVESTQKNAVQAASDARQQYEERYVWFEDALVVGAQTGRVYGTWTMPYQGKHKRAIGGAEFYDVLGRPDLSRTYRNRVTARWSVLIGGTVASLAGVALVLSNLPSSSIPEDPFQDCLFDPDRTRLECEAMRPSLQPEPQDDSSRATTIGIGLGVVGVVAMTASVFIKPHPVSAHEARKLADEYNQGLKKDLGLEPDDDGDTSRAPGPADPGISWQIAPVVHGHGGGLSVQARF